MSQIMVGDDIALWDLPVISITSMIVQSTTIVVLLQIYTIKSLHSFFSSVCSQILPSMYSVSVSSASGGGI